MTNGWKREPFMLHHVWKNQTKLGELAKKVGDKYMLEVDMSYEMQYYVLYFQDVQEKIQPFKLEYYEYGKSLPSNVDGTFAFAGMKKYFAETYKDTFEGKQINVQNEILPLLNGLKGIHVRANQKITFYHEGREVDEYGEYELQTEQPLKKDEKENYFDIKVVKFPASLIPTTRKFSIKDALPGVRCALLQFRRTFHFETNWGDSAKITSYKFDEDELDKFCHTVMGMAANLSQKSKEDIVKDQSTVVGRMKNISAIEKMKENIKLNRQGSDSEAEEYLAASMGGAGKAEELKKAPSVSKQDAT